MVPLLISAIIALLVLLGEDQQSEASCYFQQEFQGEYIMQSSGSGIDVQYATINVTSTSIPIWGNCHNRYGNNFILMISYAQTSCITCLYLKLRSQNILQVLAASHTISKCYTNEETAIRNCPSDLSIATNQNTSEILLFKVKDAQGLPTNREYCPLVGKYFLHHNEDNITMCTGPDSTIDTCPTGSTFNLRLKRCAYENKDFKFQCLGNWGKIGSDERYLAIIDERYYIRHSPKYRCAMYSEDKKTGNVYMALSSDSTCKSDLTSSKHGFETYLLTPQPLVPWPAEVSLGTCNFPFWMQGNWEYISVNRDTLVYRDHGSFKTYTIKCVGIQEDVNKYLIFSRTQCNEEFYTCVRIMKRSKNILEFQMGSNVSNNNNIYDLCAETNFEDDDWITQGRLDIPRERSQGVCPIAGEYTGVIPDATDLCAKLWSDCRAPELMYYQVSHCETLEVYEEREYRCLGHWKEQNLLYTYTQRNDVATGTSECFVGSMLSTEEIFIKEAGSHCQRNIDPIRFGMKLYKKGLFSCINKVPSDEYPKNTSKPIENTSDISKTLTSTVVTTKTTRKPWNFDNDVTDPKTDSNSSADQIIPLFLWQTVMISILRY